MNDSPNPDRLERARAFVLQEGSVLPDATGIWIDAVYEFMADYANERTAELEKRVRELEDQNKRLRLMLNREGYPDADLNAAIAFDRYEESLAGEPHE